MGPIRAIMVIIEAGAIRAITGVLWLLEIPLGELLIYCFDGKYVFGASQAEYVSYTLFCMSNLIINLTLKVTSNFRLSMVVLNHVLEFFNK